MGIGYRLDKVQGLTVVVWDGKVSDDEAAAYLVRLAADPAWPPGRLHLTDLTTASSVVGAPNTELLGELVAGVHPFRMAIVAPNTPGAAQHFDRAATSVGTTVNVFDDVPAACSWLGVDHAATRDALDTIRREL